VRILIVNTDYPQFLSDLYARSPGLSDAPYAEQLQARYDSLFSVSDFYSHNLRALGHEAWDVYANNEPLQRAWAREHGLPLPPSRRRVWRLRRGFMPWRCTTDDTAWFETAMLAQIEHYRPDVLINQNVFTISDRILRRARPAVGLMAVQHAATQLPEDQDWSVYDLAISSFPLTVDAFRRLGVPAEFHPLGFEPRLIRGIGERRRDVPVSFVGSLHPAHSSRTEWLEEVVRRQRVDVWTATTGSLDPSSPVLPLVRGSAWGRAMYEVLASSRITLNHHGNVGPYANNLRLFEATGMGALLITDWKPNLSDYFDVGREVVAYRSSDECAEQIRYYLAHDDERITIASAGQNRTIAQHTWPRRMKDLVTILERHAP